MFIPKRTDVAARRKATLKKVVTRQRQLPKRLNRKFETEIVVDVFVSNIQYQQAAKVLLVT